jgi:hypothetical protein
MTHDGPQGTLECWRFCVPEAVRKKYYSNVRPHLVTELIALRTGSYTARLCKDCAKFELERQTHKIDPSQSSPNRAAFIPSGRPWWTRAGFCAVCGIEVHLNPSLEMQRKRHPEMQLLCSSTCGRAPRRSSRAAIRALQEAELQAEQDRAEARRKERQRTDQLINDLWPEDEAF